MSNETFQLEELAPLAVHEHAKTVKDGVRAANELLEKSKEVVDTLEYLATEIRGPWAEYETFIKGALTEVREQRIALGSETRNLMSALTDVRKFFLDENHEKEVQRLREFIDLCERLKALKEDGFIDAVADTILKISPE